MENNIKQSKQELLDAIHNLMGILDTPIGRRHIAGSIAEDIRKEAREILESNGIKLH